VKATWAPITIDERLCGADDQQLIQWAKDDRQAFAELYRRHAPAVFWYLLTYSASESDAADLTQQVFLRALEALPRYQQRTVVVRPWLLRIARNAAIDAHRRRRYRSTWRHVEVVLLPDHGPGPEALAIQREEAGRVSVLLGQLSDEKRELLALRFAGDLTIAEIAEVVGKNEEAVKKQLQRLVRWLKEECDAN